MIIQELVSDEINDLCFLNKVERYVFNPFWVELDEIKLACYYNNLDSRFDTLVIFHGNGEAVLDYKHTYLEILKNEQINIFIIEYRGYGESTGESNLINCLNDAERIFVKLNLPPEKTIILGRSFGAIPAIHVASKFNCKSLILENGIYDVKSWLIRKITQNSLHYINIQNLNDEIDHLLNNKSKISLFSGKLLVLHCRFDMMVPYEHAVKVFEDANEPKKLVAFDKGIHNIFFSLNKEEIYQLLKKFIEN